MVPMYHTSNQKFLELINPHKTSPVYNVIHPILHCKLSRENLLLQEEIFETKCISAEKKFFHFVY